MDFPGLLAQLLNGVQYGLLLFLIASGLTLIFGVMGIINLAHGSLFMLGAYLAFLVARQWGSVWLALPVAVAVGIAAWTATRRGRKRGGCSTSSAFPIRRGGSTPIRTRCRAGRTSG